MSAFLTELRRVARDLDSLKAKWALVGAFAVSIRGEPRTTKDIDVALAVESGDAAEKLVGEMLALGYSQKSLLMHTEPTRVMGIRIHIPTANRYLLPLDLLFSSSGIENEIVSNAERMEIFPDLVLPVATIDHLIAMKVLSQDNYERITDQADLRVLVSLASDTDLQGAREALKLISERGFARGKDLMLDFDRVIQRLPF